VRAIDLACLYGGDEFVVVMTDTPRDQAHRVANLICQSIAEEPIDIGDDQPNVFVTASIGVSCLDGSERSGIDLMERADAAMYLAKEAGGNRVVVESVTGRLS
jgi:two-component system cell cycle response regulator